MNLWITGDSTTYSQARDKSLISWGEVFHQHFNLNKVNIINAAQAAHSIRDFVNRGRWAKLMTKAKKGDILLSCHGHLERAPLTKETRGSRGSLRGDSDEFIVVEDPFYKTRETVRTFGWYIRQYISDCKALEVELIFLSPPVRSMWEDGKIRRGGSLEYINLTRQIALEHDVRFLDAGESIAEKFNELGEEAVRSFFVKDNLHTNKTGAEYVANIIFRSLLQNFPKLFQDLTVSTLIHDPTGE